MAPCGAEVLGEKKHLCVTTGTSSGKSLAFALPILEAYRRDPNSKALVLFPTKALAQDQPLGSSTVTL